MPVRAFAAAAAAFAAALTLAVPVAAKNVTCTVYCPPPPVPLPPQAVQTNPAANNGALNGTIHSGQHPGASVQGFFANPPPGLAKQLVDDAKAGADVNVKLADTPANRKLADEIARAGGHVTLVQAATTVSVAVVGKTGYLSTNLGVGVAITNQNTLATLQNVLSKAGSPKFGGVHQNGVFTAPGAAFYVDQALKTASKTLVLETGDLNSVQMQDAIANLAKRGVQITLIVPANVNLGALATTLESHGDKIHFTNKPIQGTAMVVDNNYAMVSTGDLNYQGLTRSEQVGVAFTGSGAKDLGSAIQRQA